MLKVEQFILLGKLLDAPRDALQPEDSVRRHRKTSVSETTNLDLMEMYRSSSEIDSQFSLAFARDFEFQNPRNQGETRQETRVTRANLSGQLANHRMWLCLSNPNPVRPPSSQCCPYPF